MRLGQLARKLTIRPVDILEFLATKQIQVENDSNAKLDDELVILITHHFSPETLQESAKSESKMPEDNAIPETNNFVISAPVEEVVIEQTVVEPVLSMALPAADNEVAIIKAPKVELSGLKILGKIDLPEPKKKDVVKEESEVQDKEAAIVSSGKEKREEKRPVERRRQSAGDIKPRKNPIALQREREIQEAEKRKQERAIQQKEQRTNNYLKKVRTAAPTKSAKLIAEPLEELTRAEEPPKTFFARFLHWLKR